MEVASLGDMKALLELFPERYIKYSRLDWNQPTRILRREANLSRQRILKLRPFFIEKQRLREQLINVIHENIGTDKNIFNEWSLDKFISEFKQFNSDLNKMDLQIIYEYIHNKKEPANLYTIRNLLKKEIKKQLKDIIQEKVDKAGTVSDNKQEYDENYRKYKN